MLDSFTPDMVKHAKALWADKKFQKCWERKDSLDLSILNQDYIIRTLSAHSGYLDSSHLALTQSRALVRIIFASTMICDSFL